MPVAVWDTYTPREDGKIMHFDILVPNDTSAVSVVKYGNDYLKTKGFRTNDLTAKACRFCHIEMPEPKVLAAIKKQGYFIVEMENCN